MAASPRYVRRLAWQPKPGPSPAAASPPALPFRLSRGLVLALWISLLFALATLLMLIRSWLLDAPASEADVLVGFGVGGVTWLTSLGYYALWQLDKSAGPRSVRAGTDP